MPIGCITVLFAVLAARQAGAAPRAAEIPPKVEESAYRACGVNCVYAICGILGTETRLERVRALLRPRPDGRNSLAELASGMRELGFVPVLARLDPLRISLVTPPAILHVKQLSGDAEGNHFLVYLGRTEGGSVAVLDPPNPPEAIPAKRLEAVWTGVVLIPCKSAADAQATRAALGQSTWVWWADVWFWTACVLVVTLLLVLTRGEPARRLAKAR